MWAKKITMPTDAQDLTWGNLLEQCYAPLGRFNPDDTFIGYGGSCAVIDVRGRRYACSALHVFLNHRIHLQLKWSKERNATCTKPLISYPCWETPNDRPRLLDFTACDITQVTETPMLQNLDQSGSGEILNQRARTIFSEENLCAPNSETEYGFAGITLPKREDHPSITIGTGLVKRIRGLTYVGDEDGYHIFKLPTDHPGHKVFKGCSGAPIIDIEGNIVAFVCSGDVETSIIKGFPATTAKKILIEYSKEAEKKAVL